MADKGADSGQRGTGGKGGTPEAWDGTSLGVLQRAEKRRKQLGVAPRAARQALGQFLTPAPVATLMARMLPELPRDIVALDAGAGAGALTAALTAALTRDAGPDGAAGERGRRVVLHASELDPPLLAPLSATLADCVAALQHGGHQASHQLHAGNFLDQAAGWLRSGELRPNVALVNPPYRKIRGDSRERRLLSQFGIETANLYTAFLALLARLLAPGGVLCAICPRSFCNGPFFRAFRRLLFDEERLALRRVHEFTKRTWNFANVLQETIIFTAVKGGETTAVRVSRSRNARPDEPTAEAWAPATALLRPGDDDRVLYIPLVTPAATMAATADGPRAADGTAAAAEAGCTLAALGVLVSTGRVVDFRATAHLRDAAADDTAPLLYPVHVNPGRLLWPQPVARKAQHIALAATVLLLPLAGGGRYVLVRRFSSKEQRRRVVAACCSAEELPGAAWVGVENHVNVLSGAREPLSAALAAGLCGYLNSTRLDQEFRQLSGHTQVNASDLRRLPFPGIAALLRLGEALADGHPPGQEALDALVAAHCGEDDAAG